MIVNVLIHTESTLTTLGLEKIIKTNLVPSNVIKDVNRRDLLDYIKEIKVEFLVIELKKNKIDAKFVQKIQCVDRDLNIIVYSKRVMSNYFNLYDKYRITCISLYSSENDVINAFYYFFKLRTPIVLTKNENSSKNAIVKLLSNREYEVAKSMLNGNNMKSIADEKSLAISTISTYKKRIFEKLEISNVLQLNQVFYNIKNKDLVKV